MGEQRMKDGVITLDTQRGRELGFTSYKYDGYLWLKQGAVYISFITTKHEGQGDLTKLFNQIWKGGYKVKVPTPLGKMVHIVQAKGFKRTVEWFPEAGAPCEVWVK
jgi:hypothetical protein